MRELIRKILHERPARKKIIKPEGFADLSKEQKKLFFHKKFERVLNLQPRIVDFIKLKFGENIEIKTEESGIWLGSDDVPSKVLKFIFYIKNKNVDAYEVKDKIIDYIENYFGINPYEYGSGISLEFYKIKWERI